MPSADIYGWATRAGSLSELDRSRLSQAGDELQRSIAASPPEPQPYYERILRITWLAFAASAQRPLLPQLGRADARDHYRGSVDDAQAAELAEHLASPFPTSVEKGEVYGEVEPVMIDADIFGWVSHDRLDPLQKRAFREAADELARSLDALPADARPYFERLLRLARRAAAL